MFEVLNALRECPQFGAETYETSSAPTCDTHSRMSLAVTGTGTPSVRRTRTTRWRKTRRERIAERDSKCAKGVSLGCKERGCVTIAMVVEESKDDGGHIDRRPGLYPTARAL